jgi:hypothetical protein
MVPQQSEKGKPSFSQESEDGRRTGFFDRALRTVESDAKWCNAKSVFPKNV